jgi:HSP20 family molecular chaperone IbpA
MSDTPKGMDALNMISERLGALFKQVQEGVTEAASKGDDGQSGETHFSIPGANGPVPGVLSYGFRSGSLSSIPRGRTNAKPTRPAADFEVKKPAKAEPQQREPVIEIFEEEDHYLLTAELPGVGLPQLAVTFPAANEIHIRTNGTPSFLGHRKFVRAVESAAAGQSFRNGILELTLPFAKDIA